MAANAVVLVIGGYQISIAKYLRGVSTYPHIKFERDRLNIYRVRVFASSGSTGGRGGDAKTIISPNTSWGGGPGQGCLTPPPPPIFWENKATRSPEISREQVQKLTPQFLLYIYIAYRFPVSLSTIWGNHLPVNFVLKFPTCISTIWRNHLPHLTSK